MGQASKQKNIQCLMTRGGTHVETTGIKLLLMFVGAFILGFVLGYKYALAYGGNGCAE